MLEINLMFSLYQSHLRCISVISNELFQILFVCLCTHNNTIDDRTSCICSNVSLFVHVHWCEKLVNGGSESVCIHVSLYVHTESMPEAYKRKKMSSTLWSAVLHIFPLLSRAILSLESNQECSLLSVPFVQKGKSDSLSQTLPLFITNSVCWPRLYLLFWITSMLFSFCYVARF